MDETEHGHRDEKYFNAFLGMALRSRDARIKIVGERTRYLDDLKHPDFVVPQEGREQVLVNNKYGRSEVGKSPYGAVREPAKEAVALRPAGSSSGGSVHA